MIWFCRHKWKTIQGYNKPVYTPEADPEVDLPIRHYQIVEQQCELCGKQIVRKYRA